MRKFELIEAVAEASGHSKAVVREVLDAAADAVRKALRSGSDVFLFGLGKLSIRRRGEKRARDLRTGESVTVPPRNVALYRPSDSVDAAVNNRD